MKIAVIYQSRGGNTQTVAELIAETLGIKAESIDKPLDENINLLFIGGGVYKWDADPQLKNYLKSLDPKKVGEIAGFSTAGGQKVVLDKITEFAKDAGICVNKHKLFIPMFLKGHSALGLKSGNLNKKQKEKIQQFAKDVINDLGERLSGIDGEQKIENT